MSDESVCAYVYVYVIGDPNQHDSRLQKATALSQSAMQLDLQKLATNELIKFLLICSTASTH